MKHVLAAMQMYGSLTMYRLRKVVMHAPSSTDQSARLEFERTKYRCAAQLHYSVALRTAERAAQVVKARGTMVKGKS